ncbi:hypothetical protein MCEREM21A_00788 [Sphingomonadaceae bacterium]
MELASWERPVITAGSSDYTPRRAKALIEWHHEGLLKNFDNFKRIVNLPWMCTWTGSLTPAFESYEVKIAFIPGLDDGNICFPFGSVKVWITNPTLVRREAEPEKLIPHLYEQPKSGVAPRLCLYLPSDHNWNTLSPISEFIVPWISEWLLNYELWHITGEWASIEAPHTVDDTTKSEPACHDAEAVAIQPALFLTAASNRLKSTSALRNMPFIVHKYCSGTNV